MSKFRHKLALNFALLALTATLATAAHSQIVFFSVVYPVGPESWSQAVTGHDSPVDCGAVEFYRVKANPFSGPDYYEVTSWFTKYLGFETGTCPDWMYISWNHRGPRTPGLHYVRGEHKFFFFGGAVVYQITSDDQSY